MERRPPSSPSAPRSFRVSRGEPLGYWDGDEPLTVFGPCSSGFVPAWARWLFGGVVVAWAGAAVASLAGARGLSVVFGLAFALGIGGLFVASDFVRYWVTVQADLRGVTRTVRRNDAVVRVDRWPAARVVGFEVRPRTGKRPSRLLMARPDGPPVDLYLAGTAADLREAASRLAAAAGTPVQVPPTTRLEPQSGWVP